MAMKQLSPKLMRATAALSRLLPNIGGADASCLYMSAIRSMALYGAPICGGILKPLETATLQRAQRIMAVRCAEGFRSPPFSRGNNTYINKVD